MSDDLRVQRDHARLIAAALEEELARLDRLARAVITGLHALHQEGVVNVTTWPHAQALIAWGEEDPCRP